jgi:hypothetical protein
MGSYRPRKVFTADGQEVLKIPAAMLYVIYAKNTAHFPNLERLNFFTRIAVASYVASAAVSGFASFATSSASPRGLSCMGWTYEP